MENYHLDQDITVFYVTATSFPEGALPAHQKLHSLVPYSEKRKYFGMSRPEAGEGIVYRAAAEELTSGEGEKLGLKTLVIKKGNYTSQVILNYQKNISEIADTFQNSPGKSTSRPTGILCRMVFEF